MSNSKSKNSKKSTDIWYKVLTIFVVAIFVVGLLIAVIKPTGIPEYITLHTNTAIESENYKVNNAQMNYLVYSMYNNYYSQYSSYGSSYLSSFGLDNTLPLSQQPYMGSSTISWRDQLVTEATTSMEQCLVYCESAIKTGDADKYKDEVKEEVAKELEELEEAAKENNMSVNKLIKNFYGKGVTVSDIEELMEMQALASKYATQISESFTYVDTDYDKFFEENKNDYRYADYKMYSITAEYEKDATDEEKKKAEEEASAAAEAIKAAIEGGKSFTDAVYEYEQKQKEEAEAEKKEEEADNKKEDDKSEETSAETKAADTTAADTTAPSTDAPADDNADDKEEEKTEEELKEEIDNKILKEKMAYSDNELGKWLFGETAPAENAIKVIGEEGTYTVYQVVKLPYRDEYKTADMYYTSISVDDFQATADKKEEDLMEEAIKEMADRFAALTTKNGEEFTKLAESIKTEKGYENMFISEEIENLKKDSAESALSIEKFDEWAFSESIKDGDIKYFVSESAAFVFMYENAGMDAWKADVDTDMRTKDSESKYNELKDALEGDIIINEKAQKKIAS